MKHTTRETVEIGSPRQKASQQKHLVRSPSWQSTPSEMATESGVDVSSWNRGLPKLATISTCHGPKVPSPVTWYCFPERRAASSSTSIFVAYLPCRNSPTFPAPTFFWICRRRIHARSKPVEYRNVYKPMTTWSPSVRLSFKNYRSAVLNIPKEDRWSVRDLKKKSNKSLHLHPN